MSQSSMPPAQPSVPSPDYPDGASVSSGHQPPKGKSSAVKIILIIVGITLAIIVALTGVAGYTVYKLWTADPDPVDAMAFYDGTRERMTMKHDEMVNITRRLTFLSKIMDEMDEDDDRLVPYGLELGRLSIIMGDEDPELPGLVDELNDMMLTGAYKAENPMQEGIPATGKSSRNKTDDKDTADQADDAKSNEDTNAGADNASNDGVAAFDAVMNETELTPPYSEHDLEELEEAVVQHYVHQIVDKMGDSLTEQEQREFLSLRDVMFLESYTRHMMKTFPDEPRYETMWKVDTPAIDAKLNTLR